MEIDHRRLTGRRLHLLINPEREVDAGAQQVHGMSWEMLKDKPRFADIAQELLAFIGGQHLVIHNAPFDVGFLNAELDRLGLPRLNQQVAAVEDSLRLARELHPGQRNSLDALCSRYGIDNQHRVLHGALLDAELLAEVYLAMTRGQESLIVGGGGERQASSDGDSAPSRDSLGEAVDFSFPVVAPSAEELAAHAAMLERMVKSSKSVIWTRLLEADQAVTS